MNETTEEVRPGRIPEWMRRPIQTDREYAETHEVLKKNGLNTVCEDAKCPNRHECWNHGTATIMILGNICTRDCRFCSIATGKPVGLDTEEPERVAEAVETLKLRHVVITSVTRDDLPDGGAEIFARTITAIKDRVPAVTVEVLTPDFLGRKEPLYKVLDAGPIVFNHNVETVKRLQRSIRSGATYERSLKTLQHAAEYGDGSIKVKTGIMLGLGETNEEVMECLQDIYDHGVRLLTIGQYMAPTRDHAHTKRFVTPKEFVDFEDAAYAIGFEAVASGPLVRSSYRADKMVTV
ncbi:lipoyl synthase [Pontiella sp.]|uniref:lipoyl synthase n=1 Tax=Pontiella sp. TaxID=2837462 RepID=UPI003565F678